ncbi:inactive pancreatic lipase-related protein 1-like [Planococcus citri]|uniref:inactive pancreatic lipase-related protein 1-like n=1 Tax=Planococcus citri TaxID=170843 RepID=UPI0031F99B25
MLKRVLILSALVACAFASDPTSDPATDSSTGGETGPQENQINGVQFLQGLQSYDRDSTTPSEECVYLNESDIKYYLYTREKPYGERIESNNSQKLEESALNVKKQLKVIVHPWKKNADWTISLVRDYLYAQNVDVLVADWGLYAKKCSIETTSTHVTPFVGESLSYMLRQMISIGHSGQKMHLIGFSHGAHIAGIAGRLMAPHLPARITALDPVRLSEIARPGVGKLTGGDAKFIDVIVTSLPSLSFDNEIGDVTFYPNGGLTKYQGRCNQKSDEMERMICGHVLAYRFFAESLVSPKKFPAIKCESYSKLLSGQCDNQQPEAHMGEYVEKNVRGKYFLQTNEKYPFDKGVAYTKSSSA